MYILLFPQKLNTERKKEYLLYERPPHLIEI